MLIDDSVTTSPRGFRFGCSQTSESVGTRGNDNTQKAYWLFQAGVTVIWCLSMILLFTDIFLVKRAFPQKFAEVRAAHPYLLYASGATGILASAFAAYVTFRSPWTPLFTSGNWRL